MKILVTGAAGFIGSHTAQALLARGDEVIGLDNFNPYYDPKLKEERAALLLKNPKFRLIRSDINDRKALEGSMRGVDRVCHLAAMAGVRYSIEHPELYVEANVQGFLTILETARTLKIPGVIYASSSSVYGGNEKLPFMESDPIKGPIAMYGVTKYANELMAHAFHALYEIPVTGLRFFTAYGPWGRPDMALFRFTEAILSGKPIQIFGEGNMHRDFTFIDDVVTGIVAAIDKDYPEEIFNLARGKKESLIDFIKIIEKACLPPVAPGAKGGGKEATRKLLPMQPGDIRETHADISKAKKMLGYDPKTTIAEGIPRFVTWFREFYDI